MVGRGGMAHLVKLLPSELNALSSNPYTANNNKENQNGVSLFPL
jgi:hypothetical protein